MFQAQRLRYEPKTVVDHVSPEGPYVIGLKAMLIQSRLKHLRNENLLEDYVARVDPAHRETLLNSLASSWIPVDAALAHYVALDRLELSDTQLARMAEPLGKSTFEVMFAAILRASRNAGADLHVWTGLRQLDRLWNRIYQGGACKVTQVGPKDALLEVIGVPFAHSRSFRSTHCGFLRGTIALTAKACIVKGLAAHDSKSDHYTVSISWV